MSRFRHVVASAAWPLVDQGVISSANFLTLVICSRLLSIREFGTFAVGYTLLVLATTLQSALVTQPHNVLGSTLSQGYRKFTGATAISQLALAMVFVAAAAVVSLVAEPTYRLVAFALAAMIACYQAQEFVRRVLYTESRVRSAAALDIVAYGGQLPLLVFFVHHHGSASGCFLACAAASLASALIGIPLVRKSFSTPNGVLAVVVKRNVRFGSWLAVAAAAFWASGQMYVFVVGWVEGIRAAAELRAAFVVLGPLNVVFLALNTALPIRLARIHSAADDVALARETRRILLTLMPAAGIAIGLLIVCARPLTVLVVGSRYAAIDNVVRLLALSYVFGLAALIYAAALRARRDARAVAWTYLIGFATTGFFVAIALPGFGTSGAVIAMAVGALGSAIAARDFLLRAERRPTVDAVFAQAVSE